MSLSNYLAEKYLNPDHSTSKKGKKRRRKDVGTGGGLIITDDDTLDWKSAGVGQEGDDDEPVTVVSSSDKPRRVKRANWKTVGTVARTNAEQAAADAIIASMAAENFARDAVNEEAPEVVEEDLIKMESGAHAGLQTAAQVTAAMKKREAEELRRFAEGGDSVTGKGQETIYRDASGRIINISMKRAEARRKAEEEEKKKLAEAEARKGDVQIAEKALKKEQLQNAKYLSVARYADDAELNEELKDQARWNDPAANFITEKKSGKSVTGRPLYKGAAPPNRYGIRPGHLWDGVDRSNGFEKEYFAARNRRANIKELQYAWQMDE